MCVSQTQFLTFPPQWNAMIRGKAGSSGLPAGLNVGVEARMRVPLIAAIGIGVLGIGAVAGTTLALKSKMTAEEPSVLASDAEENETELSASSGATVALATPPRPAYVVPSATFDQGGVATARDLPAQDPRAKLAQAQRLPAAAVPAATTTSSCPGNPNALGVSRVVEVDT